MFQCFQGGEKYVRQQKGRLVLSYASITCNIAVVLPLTITDRSMDAVSRV